MNIVIDMNLSPEWEQVFTRDHNIKHWSRIGKPDALDAEILRWAKVEKYTILTNDLDFGAILAASHLDSPSVFQIRSQILDPLIIGPAVLECFEAFLEDMQKGALVSYEPNKSRVRRLPI